jgi:predicted DNA-binding antitoxin AbrB/MazE fold protein
MSETITAIYEGGILRPLVPLHLPEHAQVQVRIITRRQDSRGERQRVREALLAAGIIHRRPAVDLTSMVSEEELAAAANALGKAGPLSELILAEREQR